VQLVSQALSARHRIAALRNELDDELGSKLRKALRGWGGRGRPAVDKNDLAAAPGPKTRTQGFAKQVWREQLRFSKRNRRIRMWNTAGAEDARGTCSQNPSLKRSVEALCVSRAAAPKGQNLKEPPHSSCTRVGRHFSAPSSYFEHTAFSCRTAHAAQLPAVLTAPKSSKHSPRANEVASRLPSKSQKSPVGT